MSLTPPEIDRYKRHLVLREVGGQGQQKPAHESVQPDGASRHIRLLFCRLLLAE